MSDIESARRREKFVMEFIDLRNTLKLYLKNLDYTSKKDKDIIIVVSPRQVQLGTKIEQ